MMISNLQGLIFDLDGTLADTALDFPQMCRDADLPIGTKILEYCEQLSDNARVAEILSIVEHHELAGAEQATWILDAEKVLSHLYEADIPLAIVTRNMQQAARLTIERLNIPIELVITREDCQPKPSPKGLLKVARQWQIEPTNLAYIGDFQYDIVAAEKANMMSILLANKRNQHLFDSADLVIDNFAPLLETIRLTKS